MYTTSKRWKWIKNLNKLKEKLHNRFWKSRYNKHTSVTYWSHVAPCHKWSLDAKDKMWSRINHGSNLNNYKCQYNFHVLYYISLSYSLTGLIPISLSKIYLHYSICWVFKKKEESTLWSNLMVSTMLVTFLPQKWVFTFPSQTVYVHF